MFKLRTSYFYQIRFFSKDMIPVSTAVWDPAWYHEFKSQDHIWIDNNGVINGIRLPLLSPGPTCEYLCRGPETCSSNPHDCEFLTKYSNQLYSMDTLDILSKLNNISEMSKRILKLDMSPTLVLIVHEAPSKSCSERCKLQEYFTELGFNCKELNYPIRSEDGKE